MPKIRTDKYEALALAVTCQNPSTTSRKQKGLNKTPNGTQRPTSKPKQTFSESHETRISKTIPSSRLSRFQEVAVNTSRSLRLESDTRAVCSLRREALNSWGFILAAP